MKTEKIEVKMKLEDLGYDPFFDSCAEKTGVENCILSRVIAEYKETYKVKNTQGEYLARITGRHLFNASSREDYPAVGDWVLLTVTDGERGVIEKVLPRKTLLRKKASGKQESQIIAANIDVAFIVESVDRDYNLNRFERYVVLAKEEDIHPVIVLNKVDLIAENELNEMIRQINGRFGKMEVFAVSSLIGQGLATLKEFLVRGKTYCFLGSSGVGKSTLINELLGSETIRTGDISKRTGRGKHTTTTRETYFLEKGGILIDNPGMREVGMVESHGGIEDVFGEISALSGKCRFADCTHRHEPGCAILKALESDELDKEKYLNYLKLKKEADYYKMTSLEKRRKNQQFGRFKNKALKQMKEFE